nr:unnamed protein product [Spirometra erinaceieuropaei]
MTDNDPKTNSVDLNTLSFKLPPFTPSNPRVWFRPIEAVIPTSRITKERTRYSYVLQSLPFDVAVDVDDLLDPIPANDSHTQLKNAVIQRVAKSANRMLRELFTQGELGDQTPSQLMRHMRSLLAGHHMDDDDIFRQIWLDKLPVPMQQVLSMLDISTSLDKVANHADSISACYPVGAACANIQPTSTSDRSDRVAISCPERDTSCVKRSCCRCSSRRATTSSGPSRQPNSTHRGDYDDLKDTVRLLCTQVSTMCTAINSLQSARNQSPSRRRSISRERPFTTLCWYHRVYGPKARKCIPPCTYLQASPQGNDRASQ